MIATDDLRLLKRRLLAKGQELSTILADLLSGKARSVDGADRPGETPVEKCRRFLGLVDVKIKAINAGTGTYGTCGSCAAELPLADLNELPWADVCRTCAPLLPS